MDWSRFSHLSFSDVSGLLSRRTMILVLMAVFLFQATGIGYKLLALQLVRMRPEPAATGKAQTAVIAAREPVDSYRIVADRNLFGTTTKAVTDKQVAAVPAAQDAALLVELKGTVAGGPRYGFAVIEEKATRKQRLVKVGDLIAGAKVVRIERNAIAVLVNDQERILKIVEAHEGPIVPRPHTAQAPPPAPVAPPGTTVLSRAEIDAGLQDMGSLLRQAQIRPYFEGGVPDGFLISNIRLGSIYQKMGAQEGDIIQEVNGQKIRTADDVMGLLNTIKGGTGMSLTIKRRGKQETLNYSFQ